MAYANISKVCMFIKMPRWFEIWNPDLYAELHKVEELNFKEIPL